MSESFEITIKRENYRIIQSRLNASIFSVFNHATCHIIKKEAGKWLHIDHKFGTEHLPIDLIGKMIDDHFVQLSGEPGSAPFTLKN